MSGRHPAVADDVAAAAVALAREVFGYAEVAREEVRSSRACAAALEAAGFAVERGTGELHTASRAVLDSGRPGPRVGILAEYDALPGHRARLRAQHHRRRVGRRGARTGPGAGWSAARSRCSAARRRRPASASARCCRPGRSPASTRRCRSTAGRSARRCAPARRCGAGPSASTGWPPTPPRPPGTAPTPSTPRSPSTPPRAPCASTRATSSASTASSPTAARPTTSCTRPRPRTSACAPRRAPTGAAADRLRARLDAAARGAAAMHGCTVAFEEDETMEAMVHAEELDRLVHEQLRAVGLDPEPARAFGASTDVGDVSERVPTSLFFVPAWPVEAQFHTPEAERASDSPDGYAAMLDGLAVLVQTTRVLLAAPARP